MIIKDKTKFSHWQFYIEEPGGDELCLPSEDGLAPNFPSLVSIVLKQIDQFPVSYRRAIAFNASRLGMTYEKYVEASIEHQICLRGNSGLCWDGGLGDNIHSLAGRIDEVVAHLPGMLKTAGEAVTQVLTKAATGKKKKKFGSCSGCGGTTTFTPQANNLGRAGKINAITNWVPSTIKKT